MLRSADLGGQQSTGKVQLSHLTCEPFDHMHDMLCTQTGSDWLEAQRHATLGRSLCQDFFICLIEDSRSEQHLDASILKEAAKCLPHKAPLSYCQLFIKRQHPSFHNIDCMLNLRLCQKLLDCVQMQ